MDLSQNLIFTLCASILIVIAGCATNVKCTPRADIASEKLSVPKEQNKTIVQAPTIEQDVYIREAIRQIELNKSKTVRKKDFVGEYTYRASDTDSKVTSRSKASAELKSMLLSEIGVHISSSLDITKQETIDKRIKTQVTHIITSYTAGSISLKTIQEKWDGKSFYLKGKITIDPESVAEGIAEGLRAESERKSISELNSLIDKQDQTLDIRSKKLTDLQRSLAKSLLLTKSKVLELISLKKKLVIAQSKLEKYEAEDQAIRSKYDQIIRRVNSNTNKASELAKPGMRFQDVISLLGEPDSIYSNRVSYGSTVILFNGYSPAKSVVECVVSQKGEWNKCDTIQKYERYRIYSY